VPKPCHNHGNRRRPDLIDPFSAPSHYDQENNAWLVLKEIIVKIYPNDRFIIRNMKDKPNRSVNQAASLLGKRSAAARKKAWGAKEFKKRMKEYGKLGGRPKKSETAGKGKK